VPQVRESGRNMSKTGLTWEQKMDLAFNEIRNWRKKEKVTKK
jgi:hypothetical protein